MVGKCLLGCVIVLVAVVGMPQFVQAEAPSLVFSEVKIRNDTAGFDEYIEITNVSDYSVSLNDYFVAYANSPTATPDQFNKAVIATGLLNANQSIVLAKNEADPNLAHALKSPFASLSDSGGLLRLLDSNNTTIDQLAWTATQSAASAPTLYLPNTTATKSQSFQRGKTTDGHYLVNNPTWSLLAPTPHGDTLLPLPIPEPEPVIPLLDATTQPLIEATLPESSESNNAPTPTETDTAVAGNTTATTLQITELLPNPASPAVDSKDEYIELHNSGDQTIDINGYRLQSGTNFSYSYTVGEASLPPGSYQAFYVSQTGDTLSNTAGRVRLLDATGHIVAETAAYQTASEGEAWALIDTTWQWTTTPTPGQPNVLTVNETKSTVTASTKKTTSTKMTTTKTPTKSTKTTTKTTAPKAAKTASTASNSSSLSPPQPAPLHTAVLAVVGGLTLLYATYEYRRDVLNLIRRFRHYRSLRRTARTEVERG